MEVEAHHPGMVRHQFGEELNAMNTVLPSQCPIKSTTHPEGVSNSYSEWEGFLREKTATMPPVCRR
jgi:hypothetical protein